MKNLIDIINEITRRYEKKSVFKYPDFDIPSMAIYRVDNLSEMEYLPKGAVAICNGKIYMNIVTQMPTEIFTTTGDVEW